MDFKKAALFTGKLAAKTVLFTGEYGIKAMQQACKNAINKGATPPPNYDPEYGSGLADYLGKLNSKIKLTDKD